jgi:urocanate hydratase
MVKDPVSLQKAREDSLKRQVKAINTLTAQGMYFFDYGNAFLLESKRAGADIGGKNGEEFRYPSYVEDIMGRCVSTTASGRSVGFAAAVTRRTWPPAIALPGTYWRRC